MILLMILLAFTGCEAKRVLMPTTQVASMNEIEEVEEDGATGGMDIVEVQGEDDVDLSGKYVANKWWKCSKVCHSCATNADNTVKETSDNQATGHNFAVASVLDKVGWCTTAWKAITSCCVATSKEVKDILEEEEEDQNKVVEDQPSPVHQALLHKEIEDSSV